MGHGSKKGPFSKIFYSWRMELAEGNEKCFQPTPASLFVIKVSGRVRWRSEAAGGRDRLNLQCASARGLGRHGGRIIASSASPHTLTHRVRPKWIPPGKNTKQNKKMAKFWGKVPKLESFFFEFRVAYWPPCYWYQALGGGFAKSQTCPWRSLVNSGDFLSLYRRKRARIT